MHIIGIGVIDLVVIPAVAEVGEDVAAAGRGSFERVRAEHPVAEIDDVDVLFDEDVAGEGAIPEPVAQAVFVGAFAFALLLSGRGRVVVTRGGDDFADGAGLDLFVKCGDGWSVAALEAHIDTLIGLDAFSNFESVLCLHDVDSHGLFAIDMLARGDRGLKMLHVKERRRRYLDEIHIGRGGELFESVRTAEEQLAVNGRLSEAGVQLVKVLATGGEIIGEEIGKGNDTRRSVFRERGGDSGAAVAASQQAMAYR